jgi:hypothetical protein
MASPIIQPMNANQFGPNQVLNTVADLNANPPAPMAAPGAVRPPLPPGAGIPVGFPLPGNWGGTVATPLAGNALDDVWNKIRRVDGYMADSREVSVFAEQFRTVVLDRLRKIFIRLQTITGRVQGQAGAAEALALLVNEIVQTNGITRAQAQRMQDVADNLDGLNIQNELLGLMQVVNQLSRQIGLTNPVGDNAGPVNMTGGGKKKRKKGGYKFTRAAISRRSLRMKTRKLKSIKQKKPHRTKHKRRRKRSKRKH